MSECVCDITNRIGSLYFQSASKCNTEYFCRKDDNKVRIRSDYDRNNVSMWLSIFPRVTDCSRFKLVQIWCFSAKSSWPPKCLFLQRGAIILPDHFLLFQPVPLRFHPTTDSAHPHPELATAPHVVYKRSAALSASSSLFLLRAADDLLRTDDEYREFCDVSKWSVFICWPMFLRMKPVK